MAWLRLTSPENQTCVINTDQVSVIYSIGRQAEILLHHGNAIVCESADEIAGMIQEAEWRERVLAVACAIMSNEHSSGLTSEQVWARASRFANADP
jgi:hypothetical protein